MARDKQKPRKRKGHDPVKRARRFFEGTTIWTWEALRDVNDEPYQGAMMANARGYETLTKKQTAGLMYQRNTCWFFFVRALCRAPDGVAWVSMSTPEPIFGQLHGNGDKYWKHRDEALSQQRKDQVIDVGYMAQIYNGAMPAGDEEKMDAMRQFQVGGITDYRKDMWRYVNAEIANDPERRIA